MPIFLDWRDLSGLTAADIAGAHRNAKAKFSPSVTPNLAANPAKKKTGGEDSGGVYQANIEPKQNGPGDKWRTFRGGNLRIDD